MIILTNLSWNMLVKCIETSKITKVELKKKKKQINSTIQYIKLFIQA